MAGKKQSSRKGDQKVLEAARDLGSRLRHFRETARGESVKRVAGRAALAPATIRSLEDGEGKTVLGKALRAILHGYELERGLQQLLSLPRTAQDEHPVARWSGPETLDADSGEVEKYQSPKATYHLLKARANDPQMEVAIVRLPANGTTERMLKHHHGGDEIVVGIAGTTELIRRGRDSDALEIHPIHEQQLIVHRASVEHYARNPSDTEACMYIVIRAPFGLTSFTPATELERLA